MKPSINNNSENDFGQIAYRNYNPYINSLNYLLDELTIINSNMYHDPILMYDFYAKISAIASRNKVYLTTKSKEFISAALTRCHSFLYDIDVESEIKRHSIKGRELSGPTKERIQKVIKILEQILERLTEQLAVNGLIPTPEKKERELWEEEENSALREQKKAIIDVIFQNVKYV